MTRWERACLAIVVPTILALMLLQILLEGHL